MKFLIKFPTRNRPDKFKQNYLKYQYMISRKHDIEFLISMDNDDPTMNTDSAKIFLNKFPNTKYYYGNSKTKIEAVNADLDKLPPKWDVMLLASDDMIPVQPNYDDIIANDMIENFPDLDGVLHYNDARVGPALDTFCIMGRRYYERFGYVYHPSYKSVYCDNEFTDVARNLNKYVYFDRVLFQHGWINFTGIDELAARNEDQNNYLIDSQNYESRKNNGFPK